MIKNSSNTLRQRLIILRKSKKMSQVEVSSKLNIALKTYQNYEYEKNSIPHNIIIKIAELYKVSLNFILLGENESILLEEKLINTRNNTFTETKLKDGFLIITTRVPLVQVLAK